jgi:hypothetical protein
MCQVLSADGLSIDIITLTVETSLLNLVNVLEAFASHSTLAVELGGITVLGVLLGS